MRRFRSTHIAAAAALLAALPLSAQWNTNAKLCFPSLAWFGGGAPVIDGDVSDAGWRGALSYTFDNSTVGTLDAPVQMLAIQDVNNLYLGFTVSRPAPLNASDGIALMFDPNNAAERRRLIIFPGNAGSTGNNLAPSDVQFYKGTTANAFGTTPAALPSWLTPLATQTNLRVSVTPSTGAGVPTTYFLELKIPLTGADAFVIPASFGMYVDVMRVLTGTTATDVHFPEDTPLGLFFTDTPPINQWAAASIGGSCKGVFVTNITANGGVTLNLNSDNIFTATVQNNTVNASGTAVLAPQIQSTFYIANFGFPTASQWKQIPAGQNPTAPQDIPANTTSSCPGTPCFQTLGWHPTDPTDIATYTANPHQCIQVRLTARPPSNSGACAVVPKPDECNSALILTNAGVQNMNFPGAMKAGNMFRGFVAEIATLGYTVPAGRTTHQFELQVSAIPFLARRGIGGIRDNLIPQAMASATASNALIWTAHGYLNTGDTIEILGKRYELVKHIGSYGYGLQYGPGNPKWRYQFFGERGTQLQQAADGIYRVDVAPGKVAYVNATIEGDDQAGSGGPVEPAPPAGPGGFHINWLIVIIIILALIILILVLRRR